MGVRLFYCLFGVPNHFKTCIMNKVVYLFGLLFLALTSCSSDDDTPIVGNMNPDTLLLQKTIVKNYSVNGGAPVTTLWSYSGMKITSTFDSNGVQRTFTYTDNLIMLTLSRGGPIVWVSEIDAQKANIVDNDWVEVYNVNGTLTARAVVSQRIPEGAIFMYHAQEKLVNIPLSEITQKRGGIHNSVTRTVTKPTHMIGGYAQQAYGFNYYGTVGSNRDEFVILRKMDKVAWGNEGDLASRQQESK